MDIHKSLYMAEFLQVRGDLGSVEHYPVTDILFTNLYDEMGPRAKATEVIDALQGQQDQEDLKQEEKTIMIVEAGKQSSGTLEALPELFPDLPDEDLDEDPVQEQEVKTIRMDEPQPEKIVETELKQILIDPQYVAQD